MRKHILTLILLFFLMGSSALTHAQVNQPDLSTLTDKATQYMAEHPVEKVYLHQDKPYYAAGDTVYFKGYVTLGPEHKLSALSGVLHAELIAPNGRVVGNERLQIVAGTARGDFALADTLTAGVYRLRAYTNWMRNEGEDNFFEQAIAVGSISPQGRPEHAIPNSTMEPSPKITRPDVQFLPEGGSLVSGLRSRVAVKCVNAGGLGQDISGTIEDDAGDVVAGFTTRHLGMGVFAFIPQSGKSYQAKVSMPGEEAFTVPLPQAPEEGYTLSINNSERDSIFIKIAANEKTLASNKDKTLYLIAQSGGKIYYTAQAKLEDLTYTASVVKSRFPAGVVRFTLFSPEGEPVNERLAFIRNNDCLKLNLNTDKQVYAAREQVKLELNAKGKENKAIQGSFSVSVTDESKVPADTVNENNILTSLLLTSELKGTVEQPAYYFSNNDDRTAADLDNLLLTQGYRHFAWKKVLSGEQAFIKYPAEKALTISGTVKKNGRLLPNAKVTLFSKAGGAFMLDTLSDNKGRFVFKDLLFTDSTRFVVQAKVTKGQENVTLELDTIARASVKAPGPTISRIPADLPAYIDNARAFSREQQKYGINKPVIALKEVKIEAKKESVIPHSDNLNGPGNADYVFGPKELEKMICGKIIECLYGMIPGVRFDNNGRPQNFRSGPMAIVINGNFVGPEDFKDLRPDDIEGIEVIIGPGYGAIYGSRMANGGFIITTKRAHKTDIYTREAPGVITCMPPGFYKAREFYSPRYDNPKTNQKMADLRSTIYWQPNVITGKDGKASFNYFNADGKGTYRVVVEGIDADGNPGRGVYRYEVK